MKKKVMKKKTVKKANGKKSSFGMLSVKAGIDNNPNPTQADRIAGAKKGKKQKMAGGGSPGLYANIHAKRKRGEKMRKKGAKGAPTAAQFRRAKQTVRKK